MKKPHRIQKGDTFNRLTAVELSHIGTHYRAYWVFLCDCGNTKTILGALAVCGNTKSCGCLAKESKVRRISENHCEVTAIILGYKRHAKRRGYRWQLTRPFVESIIKKDCAYCGAAPSNNMHTKNSLGSGLKYSGIDRINSKKDYTARNCNPCCKICNYAKGVMSLKEFKRYASRLCKHLIGDIK